jgi:cytoskeletal protein CcmA (bactofilin family)
MKTKRLNQLIVLALVMILAFGLATPALAFDGRGQDTIVIGADEVIEDDLYLAANYITIDGTVKGDVVAFGNSITINGTIQGDLMAGGRDVTINGEVTDDVRFAAYALKLGPKAKVGDDVVAAGFSLEAAQGSTVGGTLVLAAYQALLNGQVMENANLALGALQLNGTVAGDARIAIGESNGGAPNPGYFYPSHDMPTVPSVKSGLNFGPEASIQGKLEYTSASQYNIPSGLVAGAVSHIEPPISPKDISHYQPLRETNPVLAAFLEALRFLAALVVIGLLLALLAPAWIRRPAEFIQQRPLPSLGWGVLAFFGTFFVLGLLVAIMIAIAILFGALTLGNLAGLTLLLGVSAFMSLLIAFGLIVGYLSYLVIGYLGGRWILGSINPALTEKPYWSLLLGILILVILTAIPVLGGLIRIVVVLAGLGAVVVLTWEHFRPTPAPLAPAPVPAE